jgi:hypothetical protein
MIKVPRKLEHNPISRESGKSGSGRKVVSFVQRDDIQNKQEEKHKGIQRIIIQSSSSMRNKTFSGIQHFDPLTDY